MPPNRKTKVDVVESFASLNHHNLNEHLVTGGNNGNPLNKFPPLTSGIASVPTDNKSKATDSDTANITTYVIFASHTQDPSHPSNNQNNHYWDWPALRKTAEPTKQEIIATILEEERCRQLLSVQHILLLQEAAATSLGKKDSSVVRDTGISTTTDTKTQEQNDAYWDWSPAQQV